MLIPLIVVGVIFLTMFLGFLARLIYLGRCHEDLAPLSNSASQQQVAPNPSSLSASKVPAGADTGTEAAASKTSAPKEQTIKVEGKKKTAAKASNPLTSVLSNKSALKEPIQSPRLSAPPTPTSLIPVASKATSSRGVASKQSLTADGASPATATKSPILTIQNKSIGSVKSTKSVETDTSKAISTRSSLEVQRTEIALRRKKPAKPASITTAKTPESPK